MTGFFFLSFFLSCWLAASLGNRRRFFEFDSFWAIYGHCLLYFRSCGFKKRRKEKEKEEEKEKKKKKKKIYLQHEYLYFFQTMKLVANMRDTIVPMFKYYGQ